eukprot:jgi/Chrzof1/2271/Cz11g09110.t1
MKLAAGASDEVSGAETATLLGKQKQHEVEASVPTDADMSVPTDADVSAKNRSALPVHGVMQLLKGIVTGVTTMHTCGLIHRELKPAISCCAMTRACWCQRLMTLGSAKGASMGVAFTAQQWALLHIWHLRLATLRQLMTCVQTAGQLG